MTTNTTRDSRRRRFLEIGVGSEWTCRLLYERDYMKHSWSEHFLVVLHASA